MPGRAHDLRKATAIKLAELGALPHMIQGLTGHRTLKEVEVYTRKQLLPTEANREHTLTPAAIKGGSRTPKSA